MKKVLPIFLIIFLVYMGIVLFYPEFTKFDIEIMRNFQDLTSFLPIVVATLPDCVLYVAMIVVPLLFGSIFFVVKKKYFQLCLLLLNPLVAFCFNRLVKYTVSRERPPLELQIAGIHPQSYSFPSTHTFVTFCLWGMVIYYLFKYCYNKLLRNVLIILALFWIFFVGISRVIIGVHYPGDVFGAYLSGIIILIVFINISQIYEEKYNK